MEDSNDEVDAETQKTPAIYWYGRLMIESCSMELQLEVEVRGRKLGAFMMNYLEMGGRIFGMRKSMLTVFKQNERAFKFYKTLGYEVDGISPGRVFSERRAARYSYEIMSKEL
ncbi:N-alpha-acetyltransferase 40 [Blyttiomyces sp. JEL0837]|nr:N-alpha-acetyltransferase 40 [Blyttiomyces sp. JEL0837]